MRICERVRYSVLVEFVLTAPMLLLLIMGIIQFAHIWIARFMIFYAAYCGARATLVSSPMEAQTNARAAAKDICAWITSVDDQSNPAVSIAGFGTAEGSTSVDRRLAVRVENTTNHWETWVSVRFDFPLLMPMVGPLIGYLTRPNRQTESLSEDIWKIPLSDEIEKPDPIPFIRLEERCGLPRPYRTDNYPLWSD